MKISYYEMLEIQPDAHRDVIQAVLKLKLKQNHPDQGGNPEVFKILIDARDVLLDPRKRAEYDKTIDRPQKPIEQDTSPESTYVDVDGSEKQKCQFCSRELSVFARKCPSCGKDQKRAKFDRLIAMCGACKSFCTSITEEGACLQCGCAAIRIDGIYCGKVLWGQSETHIRFVPPNLYIQSCHVSKPHRRTDYIAKYLGLRYRLIPSNRRESIPFSLNGPFLEFDRPDQDCSRFATHYCGQVYGNIIELDRRHFVDGALNGGDKITLRFEQSEFED